MKRADRAFAIYLAVLVAAVAFMAANRVVAAGFTAPAALASADAAGKALPFTPMSSDDIDTRAAEISRQAMATNAATQARPQTWRSWAGGVPIPHRRLVSGHPANSAVIRARRRDNLGTRGSR